jgi:hypothetical protein
MTDGWNPDAWSEDDIKAPEDDDEATVDGPCGERATESASEYPDDERIVT